MGDLVRVSAVVDFVLIVAFVILGLVVSCWGGFGLVLGLPGFCDFLWGWYNMEFLVIWAGFGLTGSCFGQLVG